MNKSNSNETEMKPGGLSVSFFRFLTDKVEALVGPAVIREFQAVKRRRDRYLREEWSSATQESDQQFFREIDYEYLLTLLSNHFQNEPDTIFNIYMEIARVCVQFGELTKAQDLLTVLGAQFGFDDPHRRTTYLMLKGKWAIYARELDRALDCYKEVLELYTELDETAGMVKALNNLGIITFERWETEQGKQYFQQADQMIGQADVSISEASQTFVKMNLGILEGMQGDFEQAVRIFEELETDFPEMDGLPRIKVLLNKGVALKDAGRLADAKDVLSTTVQKAKELPSYHAYGDAVLGLAEVDVRNGNFTEGLTNLSDAFKVFAKMHDRSSLAESYRIFGVLYREQAELELAESQFEISIKIGKEYGNLLYLTETFYEFSQLAKLQEDPARQREYLQKSLSYAKAMHGTHRADRIEKALNDLG